MSIRRSRLDIMLSVLSTVKKSVDKPTRIMNGTSLSWRTLQEVLSSLVKWELLREIEVPGNKRSRRRYEVTEKGVNVLTYFDGASELLDIKEVIF